MAVTPTGVISIPVSALRDMISQSATFQTWVGAANAAAALDSIHMVGAGEGDWDRPFAEVTLGENWRRAYGGSNRFVPSGELYVFLEGAIAEDNEDDFADSEFEFTNLVGGVIGDLEAMSEAGALVIQSIRMQEPPSRSFRDEQASEGQFYSCVLAFDYGFSGTGGGG